MLRFKMFYNVRLCFVKRNSKDAVERIIATELFMQSRYCR